MNSIKLLEKALILDRKIIVLKESHMAVEIIDVLKRNRDRKSVV